MRKIAIIGAGAIGSFLAAKLSPLADVWLISCWTEHIQAIQNNGLCLINLDSSKTYIPVKITSDLNNVGKSVDLAIICVKSPKTKVASKQADILLKAKGVALSMQNGLGNIEQMATIVGKNRVIQGVTSQGATLLNPGCVRHAGAGPIHLATRPEIAKQVQAIQNLFKKAAFETHLTDNLDSLLWGKLIINVGINALTAILKVPNGILAQNRAATELMLAAVAEAVQIAHAKGIQLPYSNPENRVQEVALATKSNRSSMLADVMRGVPTEIEFINGVIVREGQALGIQTPVNNILLKLVKAIEGR